MRLRSHVQHVGNCCAAAFFDGKAKLLLSRHPLLPCSSLLPHISPSKPFSARLCSALTCIIAALLSLTPPLAVHQICGGEHDVRLVGSQPLSLHRRRPHLGSRTFAPLAVNHTILHSAAPPLLLAPLSPSSLSSSYPLPYRTHPLTHPNPQPPVPQTN